MRAFWESTWAPEHNSRMASWSLLISREKMTTGRCSRVATCSAILRAKLVLPMPGRPATTMSCEGCKPESVLSMMGNPVATPMRPSLDFAALLIIS